MILYCGCPHPGQDALHGRGMRVWNEYRAKQGPARRCTACGREVVVR